MINQMHDALRMRVLVAALVFFFPASGRAQSFAAVPPPSQNTQSLQSSLYSRALNPLSRLAGPSGGRSSAAGWQAYAASLNQEVEPHNIQMGPVAFSMSTGFVFVYDSNINGSSTDPLSDFIVEPQLNIGFFWPITRRNELSLNLGLSYQYYMLHPEYASSGFSIDPTTGLEFRIYTGDFVITVYDSPSITTNPPGGDPALENTGFLRDFQNSAGFSILWDMNDLVAVTGIERSDSTSLTGDFSNLNQTSYSAFLQLSHALTPTTLIGFRTTVTSNTFSSNALNNFVTSYYGLFLNSRLTQYTSVYAEVGMQWGIYDNNAPLVDQPTFSQDADGFNTNVEGTLGGGNYLQPYIRLGIYNKLSRRTTQNLFFSREAQTSSVSNYREEYTISYTLNHRLNRLTTIFAGADINFGSVSSSGTEQFPYYQWNGRIGASFDIARNLSLGLSYQYLVNNFGETENSTYNRQRVSLNVLWSF